MFPLRSRAASLVGIFLSTGDLSYTTPLRVVGLKGELRSHSPALPALVGMHSATPLRSELSYHTAIQSLEEELAALVPALDNHWEVEDSFLSRLAVLKGLATADVTRRPSCVQALAGLSARAGSSSAATTPPNLPPLDLLGLHHNTNSPLELAPAALSVQTPGSPTLQ